MTVDGTGNDELVVYYGNDELVVYYRNYRDEVRVRRIRPVRWWFGKTEYHPTTGWMCTAVDLERKGGLKPVIRDFALTGFLAVGQEAIESYKALEQALVVSARGG